MILWSCELSAERLLEHLPKGVSPALKGQQQRLLEAQTVLVTCLRCGSACLDSVKQRHPTRGRFTSHQWNPNRPRCRNHAAGWVWWGNFPDATNSWCNQEPTGGKAFSSSWGSQLLWAEPRACLQRWCYVRRSPPEACAEFPVWRAWILNTLWDWLPQTPHPYLYRVGGDSGNSPA